MARHIEWHFPDVEESEPPVYGAIDSDKQVFELQTAISERKKCGGREKTMKITFGILLFLFIVLNYFAWLQGRA